MMRTLLPILCLAATATAQSVVIPSAVQTTRPTITPYWVSNVFFSTTSMTIPHDSHTQSIYDTADVPVPAAVWNSLAVRRPVSLGNMNSAFTANVTIVMSISPNDWTVASQTFANNLGTLQVTVFNGQISLPARANPGSWPAPWETPFPFSAPFAYAQSIGKSLVIDILQIGNSGTTPWYLEATSPNVGSRAENGGAQLNCKFSNGNFAGALGTSGQLLTGNNWTLSYLSLPPNIVGAGAFGSQGVGGNWNGIPLPFQLAGLGAPNCSWNVSVAVLIGVVANANGQAAMPTQTIPNDPALAGASFYDHSVFSDPAANALGLVTGWSSRWNIGTRIGAPGAMVQATGASAMNPSGTVLAGTVPTFQLNP